MTDVEKLTQLAEAIEAATGTDPDTAAHMAGEALRNGTPFREPGYFTCPCCGDVVIGNGTEPVCDDCAEAGCEATTDAGGELGYWGCDREDYDPS